MLYYAGKYFGQSPVTVTKWVELWLRDHWEPVRRWWLGIESQ